MDVDRTLAAGIDAAASALAAEPDSDDEITHLRRAAAALLALDAELRNGAPLPLEWHYRMQPVAHTSVTRVRYWGGRGTAIWVGDRALGDQP